MSDPRDSSLETKFTIPQSWRTQNNFGACLSSPSLYSFLLIQFVKTTDGLSTSGMFLAGLIMVTRNRFSFFRDSLSLPRRAHKLNRFLAWPSLLLGASAWVNQHPLRTKEGGTPPIGNLMSVLHPRVPLAMLNPYLLITGWLFLPLSRLISPSS